MFCLQMQILSTVCFPESFTQMYVIGRLSNVFFTVGGCLFTTGSVQVDSADDTLD